MTYIYSVGICSTCSYIADYFTVSIQTALGDVSFTANANTNTSTHEVITGLNSVNSNIIVQFNFYSVNSINSFLAYANVLITFEVNNSIIFNLAQVTCYNTISCQVPAAFCYSTVQLTYVYSVGIINAFCYIADYFIVSIQTVLGDVSITAKANATLSTHEVVAGIYAVNIKISVQVNLNKGSILVCFLAYGNIFIAAAKVNSSTGFNISRAGDCILSGKLPAFIGICSCFFQLAYVYSVSICSTFCNVGDLLAVCVQAVACNICLVAITNASIRHIELSCLYAVYSQVFLQGQTICSNIKVVFTFLKFYRNCIIFSTNGNTIACCISGVFCIDGVDVLSICSCSLIYRCDIGTCFYLCLSSFQLCNVYSVGICSTCCNVGDLASCAVTAHRYSTFSSLPGCIRLTVSTIAKLAFICACYAAGTQSNTAFTGNLCIMTENNSVINSCFGYFISRAENNVILTAYFLIITDNLVAVCDNFIFSADYSNVRCIGNSVLITVNKVILCSLSFSTGYCIFYAGQLGVFSVISLVATADCHYRTTCIIAGLHGFNSFFLCFRNRNIIPVSVNADFFNGVGNFVAGTPN